MTELSFLLDLLLNYRCDSKLKSALKERIQVVEQNMSLPQAVKQYNRVAASLEPPVANIAQTQETSKALLDRQAAIGASIAGKPIEVNTGNGSKGPRKF